ncbi:WD40 repeat-like protein [Mycena venus]|uniref:WD40 repeat-like protein n=1 Tax=Mycena venus TaxID=2733690 RepID=A0A8H6WT66_9AGAR|nr:WD40 repeat-like protein [Mycena venus]
MSQTYSLLVQSASIPKVPGPHLGINLYVRIDINEGGTHRTLKTPVIKGSLTPKWDFETTISTFSAPADITFKFSLRHKTMVKKVIGQVTTTVSELVQRCTAHNYAPVELDIQSHDSLVGRLCVLLKANTVDQLREAAHHELLKTQQDITEISSVSAVSRLSGATTTVVSVINNHRDLGSALLKVASRLKPLVEMGDKIANIHPYVNLAWSVVTFALEVQVEADQKIIELVETMAEVYSFTSQVDFLEAKIKPLEDAILKIAIQTVECSFFIREYTGHGFLGKLGRTTFTDVSEKIVKFSQCLKQLKEKFEHGTNIQTLFISAKIAKGVESLDGNHIVSGSDDQTVRIWDAHTGLAVGEPLEGHTRSVNSVAFSPDGNHIVSGSDDQTVRIWDAHIGAAVGEPLEGHTGWVKSVAFSPDGNHIVSGSYKTVQIWDAHTGTAVGKPLEGHTGRVYSVAFSLDGNHIVSGSSDKTVRIWDAHTGVAIGEPLEGHTGSVYSVAFSPDGNNIVCGSSDQMVQIWDARSGAAGGEPLEGHTGSVNSVTFSPDGNHIVSGSDDQTVRIWDAHTGAAVREPLEGHPGSVNSVAFSPNGNHIVSGSDDQTVRIWDAHTGEAVEEPLRGHTGSGYSVAFSPDGNHIVSGSSDKTVRIWDAHTGVAVGEPLEGHTAWVQSVAFSPDGNHIVSGSSDKTVRIWDAHSGAAGGEPLEGHTGSVYSVAFSPDGNHIVSGSDDHTVRIWDAHTGLAVGEPLEGAYTLSQLSCVFTRWEITLSLAQMIKQCESGMPILGQLLENPLRGIQAGLNQLHSRQMETTLSLAQMIKQCESGMPRLELKSMWYLTFLITRVSGIPPKHLVLLGHQEGMIEVNTTFNCLLTHSQDF